MNLSCNAHQEKSALMVMTLSASAANSTPMLMGLVLSAPAGHRRVATGRSFATSLPSRWERIWFWLRDLDVSKVIF